MRPVDHDQSEDREMRKQPFNSSMSFTNEQVENENSTIYHMHNPYDTQRLTQWLNHFDNISDRDREEPILPFSSLPNLPDCTRISVRPKEFRDILLSDKSVIPQSMLDRMEAEIDSEDIAKWVPQWAKELQTLKKQQHRSNLLGQNVKRVDKEQARPATYRSRQAKDFRTLIAAELLSGCSIEAFMKLPVMQRLAVYRHKLEAPGMIEMCDPSSMNIDLATHCIASIPDQHARSFLAASALALLPPKYQEVVERHSAISGGTTSVLNGLNARIKSYVGMLHVDLEALDDMDNLACYSPSHLDSNSSQTLEAIRQQNQDLRRLMQECYNLAWARIHVHSEWLKGDVHDLVKAHRGCQAPGNQHRSCRHILQYNKLCMNTQRRVEHLTWLFCKSLKCKEGIIFVDVEHLGLDGATKILEVKVDHAKLDEVDKNIRTTREQKEQKEKERKENSRALEKPAFKGFKSGEVIDLT